MVEHEVREAMAAAVEHVRPVPDPLGRLLTRRRRMRRFGWTGAAAAVVAALVALGSGAVTSTANRPEAPSTRADWVRQLMLSPPRGNLVTDEAFMTELRAATGPSPQVLLADEAGDQQVAVVSTMGQLRFYAGPRGGTVAELTAEPSEVGEPFQQPFLTASIQGVRIGIAPSGCEVATAALPSATDWVPAGSYVVRPAPAPAEWWRVTCEGEVRYEAPAGGGEQVGSDGPPPSAPGADSDATTLAAETYRTCASHLGDRLAANLTVVWTGELRGERSVMLGASAVGGGWWVCLGRMVESSVSTNPFHTMSDPFLGDPVTAARDTDGTVIVVAPKKATQARILLDDDRLVEGPLQDGAGLFTTNLAEGDVPRARVEALDDTGAVIANGPLDDGPPRRDAVDLWGN
ncbi:hypothetical protein GCM10009687_08130 [Asanoa iriomotensis]|uniref:Uncharacterized protein n=2 Tax=Asanoa iriomotensis TaxID=234613 RepID=A0ABQ4CDS1_9ACTN|nr:hypothetical protein Air01nite_65550 [Asanoa iriomotensis]